MKLILILILIPMTTIGQNKIGIVVNEKVDNGQVVLIINHDTVITKDSCDIFVDLDNKELNLLDSNVLNKLKEGIPFRFSAIINDQELKTDDIKLMTRLDDGITVNIDTVESLIDNGILVSHPSPFYIRVEINTLGRRSTHFVGKNGTTSIVQLSPAYYIDDKPIYDEDRRKNRKIIRN